MSVRKISLLLIPIMCLLIAMHFLYAQEYGYDSEREGMRGGQKSQKSEKQIFDLDTESPQVNVTNEQANHLRTCLKASDKLLHQVRNMGKKAYKPDFNMEDIRKQLERIKEQIQTLSDQNDLFTQSLDDEQTAQLQNSLDVIGASHKALKSQLQKMDGELEKIEPDHKQVLNYARDIESAVKDWHLEYRQIEIRMNLEPLYEY